MEYKRFGSTLAMRLDKGDEITEQLLLVAQKENIHFAAVTGIGATDDFTVGVYDPQKQAYDRYAFQGPHEITGLVGSLSTMNGDAYAHLHITCAGSDGAVKGGHLLHGVISLTGEIVVQIADGSVGRKRNESLGINTWDFE